MCSRLWRREKLLLHVAKMKEVVERNSWHQPTINSASSTINISPRPAAVAVSSRQILSVFGEYQLCRISASADRSMALWSVSDDELVSDAARLLLAAVITHCDVYISTALSFTGWRRACVWTVFVLDSRYRLLRHAASHLYALVSRLSSDISLAVWRTPTKCKF